MLCKCSLPASSFVAGQIDWAAHRGLGHLLGLPLLIMIITAYTGRLPGSMKRLTWLLFAVYILQADVIIFMRDSAPFVSAFHPVMALVDFALGLTLALKAGVLVRKSPETTADSSALDALVTK